MATVGQVGSLTVETNGSGEVFIRNEHGVRIRVSSFSRDVLAVTASGCHMSPYAINGLSAFLVTKPE